MFSASVIYSEAICCKKWLDEFYKCYLGSQNETSVFNIGVFVALPLGWPHVYSFAEPGHSVCAAPLSQTQIDLQGTLLSHFLWPLDSSELGLPLSCDSS